MSKQRVQRLRRTSAVLVAAVVGLTAWAVHHPAPADPVRLTAMQPVEAYHPASPIVTGPRKRSTASPCRRNHRAQFVVVSIKGQHAWACAGRRTVISTPVTTGATARHGDATPKGTFAVLGLDRNTTLDTTADGSYPVKFWIPFHLGVWGFHDASWQRIPFGSPRYKSHGSHGCVHVPLAAMRRLFHWVHYGTMVRIT